jgi:hypothetical protein
MTEYLDARPMIRAFYEAPGDFEIRRNCLRHRPSRHWLVFDEAGNARIVARCECMVLRISRRQSRQLYEAAAIWKESYWQPLLARAAAERRVAAINREFAAHFAPRRKGRAVLETLRAWLGLAARPAASRTDTALAAAAEPGAGAANPEQNRQDAFLSADMP